MFICEIVDMNSSLVGMSGERAMIVQKLFAVRSSQFSLKAGFSSVETEFGLLCCVWVFSLCTHCQLRDLSK